MASFTCFGCAVPVGAGFGSVNLAWPRLLRLLHGFAGCVVEVTRTVAWLVRFTIAGIGILISVLGYASMAPSELVAISALVLAAAFCIYVSSNRLRLLVAIALLCATYSVAFANYISPLASAFFTIYRNTDAVGVALSSLLYSPSQIVWGLLLCFLCSVVFIWLDRQMGELVSKAAVFVPSDSGNGGLVHA